MLHTEIKVRSASEKRVPKRPSKPTTPKTKILLIASYGKSLVNFRLDFMKTLLEEEFDVFCAAPYFDDETAQTLVASGINIILLQLSRKGVNPLEDVKTIRHIKAIIAEKQIDILFPYTIKPVIYGSFAAARMNIPTICLITGLGLTFSGTTLKYRALGRLTTVLYRKAMRTSAAVIFQNQDDLQLFKDKKIVAETHSLHVVGGSGVNLDRFPFRPNHKDKNEIIKFVIVARMLKSKGVLLFLEAAKILKATYANAEFHLIGSLLDDTAHGLSIALLRKYHDEGIITYHGHQNNVAPLLTNSDVFVLPSYLREGIPRSILEALSIGMPIITTQMPGCRETVGQHKNGILIPPKALEPLVEAMRFFLENPEKIRGMGEHSRELAEKKFDVNLINKEMIRIIRQKCLVQ